MAIISVMLICGCAYSVAMTARWGQTLGKMATGIKVVAIDGSPIGLKEAWWRFLAHDFASLAYNACLVAGLTDHDVIGFADLAHPPALLGQINKVWLLAQLITIACNDRRRAIHDYFAETQVVVIEPVAPAGSTSQVLSEKK